MTAAVPFLKWAGGKRQLLPEIRKHVPASFGDYYEPFLGGGAVFFDLVASGRIKRAFLNDVNPELIAAYETIRDAPNALVEKLREHEASHSRDHYYAVRGTCCATVVSDAARTIYLNKTCFNGLYRVNRKGEFNVPMGRYTNPTICDEENLRACSAALRRTRLLSTDFASTTAEAKRGDFVYFDSPYVPVSATGNFVSYTADGFGGHDQERLALLAYNLRERGVHVLLSNADLPVVRGLYKGFETRRVEAKRNINSKAGKRGAVGELLIW